MDQAAARSGVLVVAIDMRNSPEAAYPGSVQDAHYGVRWLKMKAREWKGDPENLGVLGSSSGGHVAELLGMRPRDPRYGAIPLPEAPGLDATVAYIATRSPISDCHARYEHMVKTNRPEMIMKSKKYFDPWDSIFEGNPALILQRGEKVTLLDLLPGSYRVRVALGTNWTGRGFDHTSATLELDQPVTVVQSGPGTSFEAVTLLPGDGSLRPAAPFASD